MESCLLCGPKAATAVSRIPLQGPPLPSTTFIGGAWRIVALNRNINTMTYVLKVGSLLAVLHARSRSV